MAFEPDLETEAAALPTEEDEDEGSTQERLLTR
jgi:hypothetical protein